MQRDLFPTLYLGATLMLLFQGAEVSFAFFRVYALDVDERVVYLQPVDQDGYVRLGAELCVIPAPLFDRYAILDEEWCLPDPHDPGPEL